MTNFYNKIKSTLNTFNPRQILFLFIILCIFLISLLSLIYLIHKKTLIHVPKYGGEIHEGIIGSPRFINPLLSLSQSDEDLTNLIYSGLLREDIATGEFINDLAEKYEVSLDGLSYTFTLKNNIYFHDGEPVTADDVIFTVDLTKDENLKSPKKIEWEGIHAEKIDNKTVKFTLKQPFSNFLASNTLGILPKHVWNKLPITYVNFSDYNISPIGSGPFKIESVEKKEGIPSIFKLKSFDKFALGAPYIKYFYIHVYGNKEELLKALEKKEINQVAALEVDAANKIQDLGGIRLIKNSLPRIYAVFYNTGKQNEISSLVLRTALDKVIDKNSIISEVIYGFGKSIDSSIPKLLFEEKKEENRTKTSLSDILKDLTKTNFQSNADGQLEKILSKDKKGKTTSTSSVYINLVTTSSIEEFKKTAEIVKTNWDTLGVNTDLKLYETGDLQNVIKERNYDALIYGIVIENDIDLFAFWHSSKRLQGLNLSSYVNTKIDKIIESLKNETDKEKKKELYQNFISEMRKDIPATFIYSPDFIYAVDRKLKTENMDYLKKPSDRFYSVYTWYTETEAIWAFIDKVTLFKKIQKLIQ